MNNLSKNNTPYSSRTPVIEVVDENNLSLCAMPIDEVHKQALKHRSFIVNIYDNEGKLYLQKRNSNKKIYPSRWNTSASGHVFAGESVEEAAIRKLKNDLGILNPRLNLLKIAPAKFDTGYEFLSIFSIARYSNPILPNEEAIESGYYYTKDEVEWLTSECRELLIPSLIFMFEKKLLF